MKRTFLCSLLALGTWIASPTAHAASSFSGLYVFGDSLSDNGNIPASTGFRPSAPYADGRFSNGPVAAEYLAADLGLSSSQLFDFAIGGATTGFFNSEVPSSNPFSVTGTLSQVLYYQAVSGGVADPNALYVVWAGPNDFLGLTDPSQIPGAITSAVTNVVVEAAALHAMGAQHILVPNMPDLGLTPEEQSASAQASLVSFAFNLGLQANLPSYVTQFDTFGFMHDVVADPSAFGFSNVTDACISVVSCVTGTLAEQNQYLFWDGVHPTTAAHELLAERFATAVVPEPETYALFIAGLFAIGVAGTKKRRTGA